MTEKIATAQWPKIKNINQEDFGYGPCNILCKIHGKLNVVLYVTQVLESFKIMDYSLLLGVHNLDQAEREQQTEGSQSSSDEKRPAAQRALYSTAMESIQGGAACGGSIDADDTCVSLI